MGKYETISDLLMPFAEESLDRHGGTLEDLRPQFGVGFYPGEHGFAPGMLLMISAKGIADSGPDSLVASIALVGELTEDGVRVAVRSCCNDLREQKARAAAAANGDGA